MKTICFIFTLCFLCLVKPMRAETLLFEEKAPGILERVLLISPPSFSKDSILKLSRKFEKGHEKFRILRLVILTDANDSEAVRFGKGRDHITFSEWVRRFQTASNRAAPQAEMLRMGTSSGIRIRWSNGQIETAAAAGNSIFDQSIAGELLYLTLGREPYGAIVPYRVQLFYRINRLVSEQEAERITDAMKGRLGLSTFSISFRQDPWFIGDPAYPWFNPFDPNLQPPTWKQYQEVPEISCFSAKTITCDNKTGKIVLQGD